MKPLLYIYTLALLTLLTFANCTSNNSNQTNNNQNEQLSASVEIENTYSAFPLPQVPVMITNQEERNSFLSKHYWNLFPFTDNKLINLPEITEQGLVDYIQLLKQIPYTDAQTSIDEMLNKAKVNPTMFTHFASLYQKYLYDPNSPFRNEELYIAVVKNLLESGLLSETDQSVHNFKQEMMMKNRVGTIATDFVYTLANGNKGNMHALKSKYLLVYFTNPDCPACAEITRGINDSQVLKSIFSRNNSTDVLTVLSIFPDSNIDEWRKALPNLPQLHWVNSYDAGTVITNKRLYDIKAIPTLYLLDENKKIILKDTTLDDLEEFFVKMR